MRDLLNKILPTNDISLKWIAIISTLLLAGGLTLWSIYSIGNYGVALFILRPFLIGFCPTIIYGLKQHVTRKVAFEIGFLTLGLFSIGLLVFAIEGIICIAMIAPIGALLTWLGSLCAYAIVKKSLNNGTTFLLLWIGLIPIVSFIEKDTKPKLLSVVTSIEINANPQTVWENVIEFPQLNEPTEFIFKTGIAYPINAKIKGTGVGAVRYCNFTTGSFIEPVTVWDPPRLLKFDVLQQPQPMKELSFWDIDAPHLHDYFVSKQGQFKLTQLPNGNTLLIGTTWYYHNIKPTFYWKLWSNYIIHKIHNRVLTHIKHTAELKSPNLH